VRAPVSVEDFRQFVSALEDQDVEVTNANFGGLSLLSDEFRFESLSERLSAFRQSADFKEVSTMEDSEARLRLSALEQRLLQRDDEFAALRQAQESTAAALTDAVVRLSRIEAQFAHIQSVSPPKAAAAPRVPEPVGTTPPSAKAAGTAPVAPPKQTAAPALGSTIISDFPEIFAEFRGKQFSLLWRGGRDGFGARDFHNRCDGHANTLTLIEDAKGNIFGGFTPVEWESRKWNGKQGKENNCCKADPSLKSFLFTLKNPHNVPARRFALKAEKKDWAIWCNSYWGPYFNDIGVRDKCNANADRGTYYFGDSYTNDTGLDGKTFFTGPLAFRVKEIEVFEIRD
jgi:hypothetical protein